MAVEKYIIVIPEIHLGGFRQTFGEGTVIEYDKKTRTLYAKGFESSNLKDLEILKNNDWVKPYSKKLEDAIKNKDKTVSEAITATKVEEAKKKGQMEIVMSDADQMTREIDIRHTQSDASKSRRIAREKKEAKASNSEDIEVIRGDETIEERLARFRKEGIPKMAVVKDDSEVGHGGHSLNAGQVDTISVEKRDAMRQEILDGKDAGTGAVDAEGDNLAEATGSETPSESARSEASTRTTQEKSNTEAIMAREVVAGGDVSTEAQFETVTKIAEGAGEAKPKRRGRPKGSKNKPKAKSTK